MIIIVIVERMQALALIAWGGWALADAFTFTDHRTNQPQKKQRANLARRSNIVLVEWIEFKVSTVHRRPKEIKWGKVFVDERGAKVLALQHEPWDRVLLQYQKTTRHDDIATIVENTL